MGSTLHLVDEFPSRRDKKYFAHIDSESGPRESTRLGRDRRFPSGVGTTVNAKLPGIASAPPNLHLTPHLPRHHRRRRRPAVHSLEKGRDVPKVYRHRGPRRSEERRGAKEKKDT